MDQIDLNISIPLMVEDQDETVVYLDDTDEEEVKEPVIFKNNEALIINDNSETLLINSDSLNETVFNNNLIKRETFIINKADVNDETLILKNKNDGIIFGNSKSDKNEVNVYNKVLANEIGERNSSKNENAVLIKTEEGSQLYVNGEMVQLFDGDVIDNSKSNANEFCTPIKLYNGNVIYVVPSTVLGSVSNSDSTDQGERINDIGLNTEERAEKNKGFHCTFKNCNKSYSSFHHLKVHLRAHTGDRPFRCSVEGCNKAFSTGFGLKTHFRTHNGERPYTCSHDNCEKGFKTSGDLLKHMRTHTGERPFLCPIPNCGRSFTTCNICKVHVRTHTGERPYKCTYPNCNKTFASVTNQRNHIRIHSGEKPYVCRVEKCGRRFTEYSSLYKHNMVHQQQPHLCLICGKTYRQSSGLMMHMKSAHCKREESFWMVDKSPTEDMLQDESTAIFLVDNIPLEDGVLEDPLFSELRETAPLNV